MEMDVDKQDYTEQKSQYWTGVLIPVSLENKEMKTTQVSAMRVENTRN